MKFKTFIKQCQKKEVFKLLSIYVVSSWVILQVLSVTWQPLGLPQKSVTYLILLLLVVFPLYIFLIWKFRIASLENSETEITPEEKRKNVAFQKMYFSALGIISMVSVCAIFLIVDKNFGQQMELAARTESDKIAVLKFGNNTGDPKYDVVSKMTADWITHGITENKAGQVISQEVINDYNDHLKKNNIYTNEDAVVKEYFKPGKIISGNFYLKGNKLLFQCALKDGATDKTIIAFKPTECDPDAPLDGIDDLKETIIGYLITKDHKKEMLQNTPPKYEAYQYLLEAKAALDNEEYIALLDKAIAADSDYFEPKVLRVGYYFSVENYKKADSLLNSIKPVSNQNKRQLNLLEMYGAMLNGNNRRVFQTIMEEYNIAPWDLKTNKSAMVAALQYVNQPQKVAGIYNEIKMDSLDVQNCLDCLDRLYVKAYADLALDQPYSAVDLLEPILKINTINFLVKPLITAYIKSNRVEKVDSLLNKFEYITPSNNYPDLALWAGTEFLMQNDKKKALEYFDKVVQSSKEPTDNLTLAKALYWSEQYSEAEKILSKIYKNDKKNLEVLGLLALTAFHNKNGNPQQYLTKLEELRGDWQFGNVDYNLARFYAVSKNEDKMYEYLLKSVAAGKIYGSRAFQNDPIFREYATTNKFQNVLNFWH